MKHIICILGLTAMVLSSDVEELLKQSNDKFTAQMFHEVTKNSPGQSVVLSAFSVLSPLAELALASVGESHDELLRAISLPSDDVAKAVFSNATQQLRLVKDVELKMANRIYIAQDAQLNPQFAALSKEVFDSDVKNVNFVQNAATAQEINAWVESKTNNKIKDLVSPDTLDASTRAVLVNAIYFKGSWQKKFSKVKTQNLDFHVTKDKTVQVPTMSNRGDFRYGESAALDAKLLEMPYNGDDAGFLMVLPNQVDGIAELLEKLKDHTLLDKAVKDMSTFDVDVQLPKFKIETTTNLKEVLRKLNVNKLFLPLEAKLKNLLAKESDLFISDAVQKAFIEVDEEGSEAAAANDFGISYLSAIVTEKESFKADRPFVFYLRNKMNILFSGVYQA